MWEAKEIYMVEQEGKVEEPMGEQERQNTMMGKKVSREMHQAGVEVEVMEMEQMELVALVDKD
tara:strand:- start:73 stop:261 length:189 start_codon:yes stop_codon:yes gene_type:complete